DERRLLQAAGRAAQAEHAHLHPGAPQPRGGGEELAGVSRRSRMAEGESSFRNAGPSHDEDRVRLCGSDGLLADDVARDLTLALGSVETACLLALAAGFVGAMSGMGGGVVLIPVLTLFGLDIKRAIAISIVSVIATSSGSASAYVRDRITNLKIGMFLEMFTM